MPQATSPTTPANHEQTNAPGSVPTLSVIIPHYDDLDNLRDCLARLANQSAPRQSFEVIVADNNSSCGPHAVEKVCAGMAKLVSATIQGAGPARNIGARHACGRYLAFLDSDCRPSPDWVARGVEALAGSEMVGGHVEVVASDPSNPTPVESFELIFAFNNQRYVEVKGFSITGNMFVRREVFEFVGEFRSKVSEDLDWGRRAVALGFRWRYVANVRISHSARHDWPSMKRKLRRITRESYFLVSGTCRGRLWWLVRSWLMLAAPVFEIGKVLRSRKVRRLDHKFDALRILFYVRWSRFIESHLVMFEPA